MERLPDHSARPDLAIGTAVEVRDPFRREQSRDERPMEHPAGRSSRLDLAVGTSVEVRGHFRGDWSRGFEVAETTHDGYWVRRLTDRYVLPVQFLGHDVRRAS